MILVYARAPAAESSTAVNSVHKPFEDGTFLITVSSLSNMLEGWKYKDS